eukprot:gene5096-7105_t
MLNRRQMWRKTIPIPRHHACNGLYEQSDLNFHSNQDYLDSFKHLRNDRNHADEVMCSLNNSNSCSSIASCYTTSESNSVSDDCDSTLLDEKKPLFLLEHVIKRFNKSDQRRSTKHRQLKSVKFSCIVNVLLIPTRAELDEKGISNELYWKPCDYCIFKAAALNEIKIVLCNYDNQISTEQAIMILYQPFQDEEDLLPIIHYS